MAIVLTTKEIKTLKKFSSFIEEQLKKSKENTLWFRGAGKSSYTLSPSIHRHATIKAPEKIIELET